jgi:hypothetical protein
MNHYEKLAVVIFRVLGCGIAVFGLFGVGSTLVMQALSDESLSPFYNVYHYTYGGYGLGGVALIVLSKPLATLIAKKL